MNRSKHAAVADEVGRRAAAGESSKRIAAAVGITPRAVNRIRVRLGVPAQRLIPAKFRPAPKSRRARIVVESALKLPVLDPHLVLARHQPRPVDRPWSLADLDAPGWERRRDVRCRAQGTCLDLACLGGWPGWTCGTCPSLGVDRLTDDELAAEMGRRGAGVLA